jgi:hypothetical protein
MFKRLILIAAALGLFAVVAMGASSCDPNAATTSAMCAFIVGDGQSGHDARVHKVLYPNQEIHVDGGEDDYYVPCNSRNYLIKESGQVNANGQSVGDRSTPSIAYTKQGTKVKVWTSSYWTLNEDTEAMKKFWDVCLKYTCASNEPKSGTVNFSTPGWNGMLGENFGPSVDDAAYAETARFDDAIWQKHTPTLYKQLGTAMSTAFSESVRTKTGYNLDLFCGSGNSVWTGKPGDSTFNCRSVRIQVNDVEPYDNTLTSGVDETTKAKQDKNINATKLRAAIELYGSKAAAAYWLGLQQTCNPTTGTKPTCVINVGGSGSSVSVPTR